MAKEESAAEEKPEKVAREKQNGITKPAEGSKTGQVWDICDDLSQKAGRPALRGEVMAAGEAAGMSKGTVATQYGKWCTYHGVSTSQLKEVRSALREEQKGAEEEAA